MGISFPGFILLQGLFSSDLDSAVESAWEWMVKFKDKVYSIAFQVSNCSLDNMKSLAFVYCLMVVLYNLLKRMGGVEQSCWH